MGKCLKIIFRKAFAKSSINRCRLLCALCGFSLRLCVKPVFSRKGAEVFRRGRKVTKSVNGSVQPRLALPDLRFGQFLQKTPKQPIRRKLQDGCVFLPEDSYFSLTLCQIHAFYQNNRKMMRLKIINKLTVNAFTQD
ncbi:MAG: hypothetical protein MUD08_04410 [Cytophagales bacterium]|nr:hypothetical protein [Cytophagales bacterium]